MHGNVYRFNSQNYSCNPKTAAVAFHTALTAFGQQHSVAIGTAGGSVIKCNADAWVAPVSSTTAGSEAAGGAGVGRGGDGGVASAGGASTQKATTRNPKLSIFFRKLTRYSKIYKTHNE